MERRKRQNYGHHVPKRFELQPTAEGLGRFLLQRFRADVFPAFSKAVSRQDISTWNTRNDANMNNIFFHNDAYAAKFTCANADSGPPSSCKAKSVSEMIAALAMGTDEEDGRKFSKKHSSSS